MPVVLALSLSQSACDNWFFPSPVGARTHTLQAHFGLLLLTRQWQCWLALDSRATRQTIRLVVQNRCCQAECCCRARLRDSSWCVPMGVCAFTHVLVRATFLSLSCSVSLSRYVPRGTVQWGNFFFGRKIALCAKGGRFFSVKKRILECR